MTKYSPKRKAKILERKRAKDLARMNKPIDSFISKIRAAGIPEIIFEMIPCDLDKENPV